MLEQYQSNFRITRELQELLFQFGYT